MIKEIIQLLPEGQRKRGIWVAFSVLLRAILDFAGVAALIPILLVVAKQDGGRGMMLALCGAVLLFVLLKNALVAFLARVQSRYQLEIYREFSRRMFANYYHRGLLFLKGKSSVQLGHEVNYVCYMFSSCVLAPVFCMAGEAVLVLLMVTALIVWEPLAGFLLCASFLPLTSLYVGLVRKRLRRYGMEELEARRKQSRTVVEAYRGYAELEIARAFHTSLASFDQGMEFIVHNRLRMEVYQLFPFFLSEVAVVAGLALLIGTGSGDLGLVSGVFAVAAFRLIPAVRAVLNSWVTLQNASHTITVVKEGISDKLQQGTQNQTPFTLKQNIELRKLSFAFPDGHTLFSNLTLSISCGERIGVRGASGSGKSTLFNLMLGFFPPTSGEILIDGRKLTSANRSEWHKLVGYVPQEIFIIEGTLADNIALGQTQVDHIKMIQVLEQVQLKEWANELPQGLDTPLGEYGSRLSGGQKQRIGIARALYKEAEVLFFDEATSALDNKTEQEINHALETLSLQHRELTLIIIAHRESSLAFCDRIFDLDSGNIYTKEK
ncbi:ABC transporter ATP-binding protein [Bacteroides intestinalis]|uniref:ABC transporter ATP-binding protein n=1 Tax=Bacteroides intestinalis TaxID=329854 RepID=UPI000E5231D1|nr:ABC transporter ATP-binding protein [Bacteroides intestinalis]RGX82694.1 ABC transporter ATP-binding protein [Bacteroides intestinalis]